jgi:glycosyl transferase family 1
VVDLTKGHGRRYWSDMVSLAVGKDGTVLLSRRNPPFAGWVAIDEFEDLFQRLTGGRILCAEHRSIRTAIGRMESRLIGPFLRFEEQVGGELLLVVAREPSDLRMVYALPNARKRFRKIAGFVIDSYFAESFERSARLYDHVFSTTEEGAELLRSRFGVSASVLRQGFDCLRWANTGADRSIDVIGFGRQPDSYHRGFQSAFHTSESKILYLHSPIGTRTGADVYTERPMMLKLLQRSKMSLAFHLMVEPVGQRPRAASFVTSRWLESLGAGCLVLGKKPPGAMAQEMFPWPDALIDLPDAPSRAVEFIMSLLSEPNFISETRSRNVAEMCRRHDWRYRIRDIYQQLQLPLPDSLKLELQALAALDLPLLRDPAGIRVRQ